jgi:molecular chaperone GrpE
MYWRDIDTIAPRRPLRVRRRHRASQPNTTSYKIGEPEIVDESLPHEDNPALKDELISTNKSGWEEKAQRLQAEMDNFRKRQERRADEAIAAERERLLALFLPAIDNLGRALAYQDAQNEEHVRQGVELTRRELLRVLESEGVVPLETIGKPFDPEWHEALATIPAEVEPGTIVEQVETGYKLGDKLLCPARVVVAAKTLENDDGI